VQVTLVGLPAGLSYTNVYDPGTGIRFEPGVTVNVDDPTVQERLGKLEAMGYSFLFDGAALDVVPAPTDVVSIPLAPDPVAAPAASS
jgi:hypothetical protein